jgi:hypothetical protein
MTFDCLLKRRLAKAWFSASMRSISFLRNPMLRLRAIVTFESAEFRLDVFDLFRVRDTYEGWIELFTILDWLWAPCPPLAA